MFTRRGALLLLLAVALLVTGRLIGSQPFYIMGTVTVVLCTFSLLFVNLWRFDIDVARITFPVKAQVDEQVTVSLRLSNNRSLMTPPLVVRDEVARWGQARHLAAPIPGQQLIEIRYPVPTPRRGRITLGPTQLAAIDPFGLAVRAVHVERLTTLLVLPKVVPLVPPPIGTTESVVARRQRTTSAYDDFTLRQYSESDDARLIHWPSSARRGQLLVREPVVSVHSHHNILLDDTQAVDIVRLEYMVSFAASLLHAVRETNARFILLLPGQGAAISDYDAALEALAELEPTEHTQPIALREPQHSSTTLITTTPQLLKDIVPGLSGAPRHGATRTCVSFTHQPTTLAFARNIVISEPRQFRLTWNSAVGYGQGARS